MGVEDERAKSIYAKARSERIKILRAEGLKSLLMGFGGVALAIGIYFIFNLDELSAAEFGDGVNGTAVLPWLLGFLGAVAGAFGVWKATEGITDVLFASMKKGSIADR